MIKQADSHIYQMQAEICKTFTAPARIMIIEELNSGPKSVSELEEVLKIRQATLSQHLAVLRSKGILVTQRKGQHIFYRIANPKIIKACQLMREVLIDQIEQNNALVC